MYIYLPIYSFSGSWFMLSDGKNGHYQTTIRMYIIWQLFRVLWHCRINAGESNYGWLDFFPWSRRIPDNESTVLILSENILFICTRWERGQKSSLEYLFLNIGQINLIFSVNLRILSTYQTLYYLLNALENLHI